MANNTFNHYSNKTIPFLFLQLTILFVCSCLASPSSFTPFNSQHATDSSASSFSPVIHQSCTTTKKTTGQLSASHSAHAVPGVYPPSIRSGTPASYVDSDGDGFYSVTLDGTRSHTHYINPQQNTVGSIISTTWTDVSTKKILSRNLKFNSRFPVGKTRLSLTVVDSACNSHTAFTTVTVTSRYQQGSYCYFYPDANSLPRNSIAPVYSNIFEFIRFNIHSVPFRNQRYFARCLFNLEPFNTKFGKNVKLSLSTSGTGTATLYKSNDISKSILKSNIFDTDAKSVNIFTPRTGRTSFELHYAYTTTAKKPSLSLRFDNVQPPKQRITHDASIIKPILTAIVPSSGKLVGGTRLKLLGHGLYPQSTVTFKFPKSSKTILVSDSDNLSTETFVVSPKSDFSGSVKVYLTSATGIKSNQISFTYSGSACDGPAFEPTKLSMRTNNQLKDVNVLEQPTCATLGPDNMLYVGTTRGTVGVLGFDSLSLTATTYCTSQPIIDSTLVDDNGKPSPRSILGITFNPSDKEIRPYVSTSTLNWWSDAQVSKSNRQAWHNGAIDRMRLLSNPKSHPISSGNNKICVKYDKRIISGLPVANGGGHSVNALTFTPFGDLLIAVGGSTNMGLPGYKLGSMWESPLSGAVLIARISRGNKFNGNIRYSNSDKPYTAKKISGNDVDIFASGVRNMFAMTKTVRGQFFGLDQGPGCPLGGPATSCMDFNKRLADTWTGNEEDKDWPTNYEKTASEEKSCSGIRREDKLLHLQKGKFYGHANIQRGECLWIDPLTGKSANGKSSSSNYKGPITMVAASATSVNEYGANHFCGKMRGDLVISTFRGITTWRVKLQGNINKDSPEVLSQSGGLAFVEDVFGNLIFPRFSTKGVDVLKPIVSKQNGLKIIGVSPKWHRRQGGSSLFVGGMGFSNSATQVWVGKVQCGSVNVEKGGRLLNCKMPARSLAGANLVNVKVIVGGKQRILNKAVAYMRR